jgi:gamma-glutamyltranspeptidase/glutathione hydrolase
MDNKMTKAAVASGHPQVTEAAREILQDGGNAFDAVVAAGFASSVAEPALTSLGGGGFLLARTDRGDTTLCNFFVDTPGRGLKPKHLKPHFLPITVRFPGSDQIFNTGLGSAAVPGNLRGFLHIHEKLGCLPLARVLAPAIRLARHGLQINSLQAYVLNLLYPIMTLTPAGRTIFEPDGRYLGHNDRFTNPDLAAFLETLPYDGDRAFYEGELARRIAADMDTGNGLITMTDLAAYQIFEYQPLCVNYRRFQLLTNPPPSWGGILMASALRLLESYSLDSGAFGSTTHAGLLANIMIEVERQRAAGHIDTDVLCATALDESLRRIRTAFGGTTHISVCDKAGNVASMTTSNGEGSGYMVPGTGIMLNNMLGEDDLHPNGFHASEAGQRVASMMSPSLLLDREQVKLVLGSGGSKRIRTALLQVISNVVDFGMDLKGAIEAPRMHWDGDCLQIEPGFPAATLDSLGRYCPTNPWPVQNIYFGGVHGVSPYGESAGDPRRGGCGVVID